MDIRALLVLGNGRSPERFYVYIARAYISAASLASANGVYLTIQRSMILFMDKMFQALLDLHCCNHRYYRHVFGNMSLISMLQPSIRWVGLLSSV